MSKFEVGQKWRTRDGRIANVTEIYPDDYYPVKLKVGDQEVFSTTYDGREFDDQDSQRDLKYLIKRQNANVNMKFRVLDEHHSAQIQKYLFGLGYSWWSNPTQVQYTSDGYLYTSYDDKIITRGDNYVYFQQHQNTEFELETSYHLVQKKVETIEIDGVTYEKSKALAALASLRGD